MRDKMKRNTRNKKRLKRVVSNTKSPISSYDVAYEINLTHRQVGALLRRMGYRRINRALWEKQN